MTFNDLVKSIRAKKSFLCVGLDPDLDLLPKYLLEKEDPIFEFNKLIIDATKDFCVAYKPNLAFYEKLGPNGLISLHKTLQYIPKDFFIIADAKRSDIFNSANMYAKTFYTYFNFDAVTLSPYMGVDAVNPFLKDNKWAILLIATSNPSASAVQNIKTDSGEPLYIELVNQMHSWGDHNNIMFVVGATRTKEMAYIRKKAPDHFFLVPGIGAQGGDIDMVCQSGLNHNCGLLINVSRSIIYAGSGKGFENDVRVASYNIQQKMESILREHQVI